jgi:hypothetical protein
MDPLRLSAETQGFFTRTDALSAGHDDNSIRRALKVRLWTRVRAGAYTYPELWPPDAESRHRIRGRAVAGKLGVDVALSHTTSSIVHDLRHWQVDLDLVHVTRLDAGAGRTESGVVHHSGLVLPSDLVEEHGIRRTHAARAAIETASLTSTESALVTLDSALQLGKCTRDELDATYRLMQCWPGMRRVQVAVRLADAGAQSVGESRSRYLFYSLGLPAPRLQYEVSTRPAASSGSPTSPGPSWGCSVSSTARSSTAACSVTATSPATQCSGRRSVRTGCERSPGGASCG